MFNKQQNETMREAETIIGLSVKVKGDFTCQGNMVVEGEVDGTLKTHGDLIVGDKAKISANIEAKNATISGEVNGNLKIKGYLELSSTAKINGDIDVQSISIIKGAILNGQCQMKQGEEKIIKNKE